MVQQNGNKQHFTINSTSSSNPANRTLESIYQTFNFVFSVRPEVNLDVHPCGLDHICEHPRATKLTQQLTEWCVSPSLQRRMFYPQQSLTIVVLCRIHALMMASRAISNRCPQFPLDTNKNPHCCVQPATITLLRTEASILCFHNIATPTPDQPPLKKAVKNK